MERLDKLVLELFQIGVVKFGSYKLKSGITSPIYFDLRLLPSFPHVLEMVGEEMWSKVNSANVTYDVVCGVPYTALPIATVLALKHNSPMLIVRKEKKEYGTKQDVEGVYKTDGSTRCLIMEDVVTTGGSVLQTAQTLRAVGLNVQHAVVFLDREQGGSANVAAQGITLHSVVTIKIILDLLLKHNKIDAATYKTVEDFISRSQMVTEAPKKFQEKSFVERAELCKSATGQRLLQLMHNKQTNLAVAADVGSMKELLELAEQVGPHICVLKTHVDILADFDAQSVQQLRAIAQKHNFLLFEDRKFADIGNVVKQQYSCGLYKIKDWADIVDSHLIAGASSVSGLKEAVAVQGALDRGLLLIAQMSTQDTMTNESTVQASLTVARQHQDFVFGFICQQRLSQEQGDQGFVYCTPGVNLQTSGDSLGQQYNTPEHVVVEKGVDVIIVGRGIVQATDRVQAAQQYRDAGWKAYQQRLSKQ